MGGAEPVFIIYKNSLTHVYTLTKQHQKIVNYLQSVIQNDSLNHAYLFYGPPGLGKSLVADYFIKSIYCLAEYCAYIYRIMFVFTKKSLIERHLVYLLQNGHLIRILYDNIALAIVNGKSGDVSRDIQCASAF